MQKLLMQMATNLEAWIGLDYLLNPQKRLFWGFLLSSCFIAFIFAVYKKTGRQWLSRDIWWHHSAKLDYQYYIVFSLIKGLLIYPFIISAAEMARSMLTFLIFLFDYRETFILDSWIIIALYTGALFIFSDFTRYWLHRLLHTVPWLWHFHQVHHSATVLTPITFYRVHPVESLLFGFRYAFSIGLITAIFLYLFGAQLSIFDILGVNGLHFLALLLGANLRHSPVPLAYPTVVECWFISPRQHQLHHSTTYNSRNFGGVLAIWDWLFNTLKTTPKYQTNITLGIQSTDAITFKTVLDLFWKPIASIFHKPNKA